jgi:hypothetical protein
LAIQELRHGMPFYSPLQIVVSGGMRGQEEQRFLDALIEDKTMHENSYVDFLCGIHKLIQAKMGL